MALLSDCCQSVYKRPSIVVEWQHKLGYITYSSSGAELPHLPHIGTYREGREELLSPLCSTPL